MRHLVFHTDRGTYVFDNMGAKEDIWVYEGEETGEWRRLHNEEMHDLYFTANILVGNP
jgi:hypothetical protein